MGKLNEHRVKVRSQVQIQLARLEKGMIVKARYNPKDGDVRRGAQEYMLLILNPIWQKKVHALSLDAFSNVRLNQLAEDVGLFLVDYKFNDSVENKFLLEDRDGKTDVEKLKIDLNKESKKL